MTEKKYVQVRNLAGHPVVYKIEERHLRRVFGSGQVRKIEYEEIQELNSIPGGDVLLRDFLAIEDAEVAEEVGVSKDSFDHEYSWTTADVDNLLRSVEPDALDRLEDALDFAPEGIVDQIIDRAVTLRIPDVRKRKVIFEHTGRDVSAMIQNQIEVERQLGEKPDETPKERRVQDTESSEKSSGRRVN